MLFPGRDTNPFLVRGMLKGSNAKKSNAAVNVQRGWIQASQKGLKHLNLANQGRLNISKPIIGADQNAFRTAGLIAEQLNQLT
jgi:hypothetical protein